MTEVNRQRIIYALADYLTANVGFLLFDIGRFFLVPPESRAGNLIEFLLDKSLLLEQCLVPLIMVAFYALWGSYNRSNTLYKSRLDETITTFSASFLVMLIVFFVALINDNIPERATNYELMALLFFSLSIPTYIVRLFILNGNAKRIRKGDYVIDTYVIGASSVSLPRLGKIMRNSASSGLKIVGCIDCDNLIEGDTFAGLPVIHSKSLTETCESLDARSFIILQSPIGLGRTIEIITELFPLDRPIFVTPDIHSLISVRPRFSSVVNEPVIDITHPRISPAAVNCKRLADVIISTVALVILLPVYLIFAIAIKRDSKGPVFYRQTRIGYHKKPFTIYKFRTMIADAEPNGPVLAQENDTRVTRLGHFMRKYRIDELPQFWNVLKGDMSLVGPRPEREFYVTRIMKRHPAYSLIHQVRPGITSWGMVKYGYASDVDQMLERLEYDLIYIENVSLAVDIKILFYTVSTILTGKGL